MHGVFIDDSIGRKGSEMNTIMTFVLNLNHCYHQKSKHKKRPVSAIYALDCTSILNIWLFSVVIGAAVILSVNASLL